MLKILEINSWQKALFSSLIQAFSAVVLCIIYSEIISLLAGGQEFIGKVDQYNETGGLKQDDVLIICAALSAFVPVFLLRYKRVSHLLVYIFTVFIFYFTFDAIVILQLNAVIHNIADYIFNSLTAVPAGLSIGIVIAIIFNIIHNKKVANQYIDS